MKILKKKLDLLKERNKKKEVAWTKKLFDNGFSNVEFPIVIIHSDDLDFIETLSDYSIDPDIHFFEFDATSEMIDANLSNWAWKYNKNIKANLPDKIIKTVAEPHVIELILNFFEDKKQYKEIEELMRGDISFHEKIIVLSQIY